MSFQKTALEIAKISNHRVFVFGEGIFEKQQAVVAPHAVAALEQCLVRVRCIRLEDRCDMPGSARHAQGMRDISAASLRMG